MERLLELLGILAAIGLVLSIFFLLPAVGEFLGKVLRAFVRGQDWIFIALGLVGWILGSRKGRKALSQGKRLDERAKAMMKTATENEGKAREAIDTVEMRIAKIGSQADEQIAESQRRADRRIAEAERKLVHDQALAKTMLAAAESKLDEANAQAIVRMATPLSQILHASIIVMQHDGENNSDFKERRDALIRRRTQQWERRWGYGHRLTEVVAMQHGMCGDPRKDPGMKGCGSWLYAMPPGTVHFDHIIPQSKRGTNDFQNIQALCHACNTSAGDRISDTPHVPVGHTELLEEEEEEEEEEELEPLPVRICPACGEDEMVREREPCYALNGDYEWRCTICGLLKAGGEDHNSELFPF